MNVDWNTFVASREFRQRTKLNKDGAAEAELTTES